MHSRTSRARAAARPAEAPRVGLARLAAAFLALAMLALAAVPAAAQERPASFADLADELLPSVVNISSTKKIEGHQGIPMPQFPPGSPFKEFFEEFLDRSPGRQQAPQKATSLGSGFIIDEAGYIVTNNHVIQGADEVRAILHDETVLEAEIIGRDPKLDLALLKVDTDRDLKAAPLGDSKSLRVGDWVLAIGNPFGLGGTVTSGIVSARARDIQSGPYDDFIQTDASINRGNSGGPLFNLNGEVVGINTAILSPSGGSIGIGFAVPANLAKTVLADLREYGAPRRGWLGVRIQSVNDEIADSLGLDQAQGALVADVDPDGPASDAGIKPGDVILSFDGKQIEEMRRLPRMVAETPIGKTVDVVVWRDGARKTLDVELGQLEEEPEEQAEGPAPDQRPDEGEQQVADLGLAVANLTPAVRERFDIPEDVHGVMVVQVERGSQAARKGIQPGDVIGEVNQAPVDTVKDVVAQIGKAREAGRGSVLLLVQNAQGMRFVALKLPEE